MDQHGIRSLTQKLAASIAKAVETLVSERRHQQQQQQQQHVFALPKNLAMPADGAADVHEPPHAAKYLQHTAGATKQTATSSSSKPPPATQPPLPPSAIPITLPCGSSPGSAANAVLATTAVTTTHGHPVSAPLPLLEDTIMQPSVSATAASTASTDEASSGQDSDAPDDAVPTHPDRKSDLSASHLTAPANGAVQKGTLLTPRQQHESTVAASSIKGQRQGPLPPEQMTRTMKRKIKRKQNLEKVARKKEKAALRAFAGAPDKEWVIDLDPPWKRKRKQKAQQKAIFLSLQKAGIQKAAEKCQQRLPHPSWAVATASAPRPASVPHRPRDGPNHRPRVPDSSSWGLNDPTRALRHPPRIDSRPPGVPTDPSCARPIPQGPPDRPPSLPERPSRDIQRLLWDSRPFEGPRSPPRFASRPCEGSMMDDRTRPPTSPRHQHRQIDDYPWDPVARLRDPLPQPRDPLPHLREPRPDSRNRRDPLLCPRDRMPDPRNRRDLLPYP